LQGNPPGWDWKLLNAGSLEKFNVNGVGNGDNVLRAMNLMKLADNPDDGRQFDKNRLGFWIEQIEEGVKAKGDAIVDDIIKGFLYGEAFVNQSLARMDTNGDGVKDLTYTQASLEVLWHNGLGRPYSQIDIAGRDWLAGRIDNNEMLLTEVAVGVIMSAEAINDTVVLIGTRDVRFIAFGDGFGN
jgi:hypothetical protein